MESIGEKLRTTRSQKGYSLEQVARDTHIAKRFIEALESEDFDVFPGEPYLLGFLRTYSEFLGLDSQEMVTLYKNLKIQEQPAPIDELIV
ncbi:MAG: helix-turn-helix domain-containing protein, partial [Spirochaetia bacterium]